MRVKIRFFHSEIEDFVQSLEKDTIAKVLKIFDILECFGCELKMPHGKKI